MNIIRIPSNIKVGSFTYKVVLGKSKLNKVLQEEGIYGRHSNQKKVIEIDSSLNKEQILCTFIHECIHAIDYTYLCDDKEQLSEASVRRLAVGIHQVLAQLGISL